ncbi:MAG TPA: DUF2752 domain-containing protein [Candidatus Udaeobacter sp.]
MRLRVCRLSPGEIDHELIWLSVSLLSLGIAAVWLTIGLPWPHCAFHEMTGLPCITCGMTRCGMQFFHAHFLTALKWNPLVFVFLCALAAYDLYALATLAMSTRRLRISFYTQTARTFARMAVIMALMLNWGYLLVYWRNF